MCEMTLQLPMNYVDIDNEEMEYVDGGGCIYSLSANQCNKLAAALAIATGVLTIVGAVATLVATVIGTPIAGAVTACIATVIVGMAGTASGFFWFASCYNGAKIYNNPPHATIRW